MKKLSILLFALFVCLPATALADIAPFPAECDSWCVPNCIGCQPIEWLGNPNCYRCRGCPSADVQEMCAHYLAALAAEQAWQAEALEVERENQEAAAQEAERQAREAAAAQQTKPLETKRSCTASPYTPSQAPIALLLFCLIALGMAIPARRQK